MNNKFRVARVAAAVGAACLGFAAGTAQGAGFALQESSASGLGNAYAGGAASADDASTVWSNPAGMSRFDRIQGVLGINFVTPSFKFNDGGSTAASFQTLGGNGGDAGSTNYVPNLYLVVPIDKQWAFGIGVSAPFGLVTEYDSTWLGRFQGIKSDVKTINVNPAISWKINDQFSVGVGADWQKVNATFTSNVNYTAALVQTAAGSPATAPLVPTIIQNASNLQSFGNLDGDDSAWGWNIGALWNVTPSTRIGAQYRSSIKYTVNGTASFDNPSPASLGALAPLAAAVNAGGLYDGGFTASIEVPDSVNLSIFSRLDDRWDVMADLQWTHWSVLKDLTFVRTSGPASGRVLQSTPENFDDTWRVSVGANYRYNDQWMFRGGLAWDQTPVNTTDRTVRLPDNDRFWLSLGVQYKLDNNWKFDGGFTYIWVNSPDINQSAGGVTPLGYPYGVVKGSYNSSVTIFGVQVAYTF